MYMHCLGLLPLPILLIIIIVIIIINNGCLLHSMFIYFYLIYFFALLFSMWTEKPCQGVTNKVCNSIFFIYISQAG